MELGGEENNPGQKEWAGRVKAAWRISGLGEDSLEEPRKAC
jgi:hypothetical protein